MLANTGAADGEAVRHFDAMVEALSVIWFAEAPNFVTPGKPVPWLDPAFATRFGFLPRNQYEIDGRLSTRPAKDGLGFIPDTALRARYPEDGPYDEDSAFSRDDLLEKMYVAMQIS